VWGWPTVSCSQHDSHQTWSEQGIYVKASMGLDSMTCTKSELVASTLKE